LRERWRQWPVLPLPLPLLTVEREGCTAALDDNGKVPCAAPAPAITVGEQALDSEQSSFPASHASRLLLSLVLLLLLGRKATPAR
jgi:hypothetical protein